MLLVEGEVVGPHRLLWSVARALVSGSLFSPPFLPVLLSLLLLFYGSILSVLCFLFRLVSSYHMGE